MHALLANPDWLASCGQLAPHNQRSQAEPARLAGPAVAASPASMASAGHGQLSSAGTAVADLPGWPGSEGVAG